MPGCCCGRRPPLACVVMFAERATRNASIRMRNNSESTDAARDRARRALALLERAAARPSCRRGPLRRVGLIAGHPSLRALLLATYYAIGASTSQLCVQHKSKAEAQAGMQSQLVPLCTIAVPGRGVFREPSRLLQTP